MSLSSTKYVFKNPNKRIIGYARVSTTMQTDGPSLDNQEERLRKAGAEFVITDVISGQKKKRPGLDRIMEMVRRREIDEVIVCALDRLGRTVRLIHRNVDIFIENDVNLKVLNQDIDLHSSHGKFLLTMLASLAELEVGRTGERLCESHIISREKERACYSKPFGFTWNQQKKYCLDQKMFLCLLDDKPDNPCCDYDPEEDFDEKKFTGFRGFSRADVAKDCIEIFLRERGLSRALNQIFDKYGVTGRCKGHRNGSGAPLYWTPPGFKLWLQNPVLAGHTAYLKRKRISYEIRKNLPRSEWDYRPNTHPDERLISEDQAKEIDRILQFNTKRPGARQHSYEDDENALKPFVYLQGLVFCTDCGAKAITKTRYAKKGNKTYRYFACRHVRKGCENSKGTAKQKIEDAIIQHLVERSQVLNGEDSLSTAGETIVSENLRTLRSRLKMLNQLDDGDPEKQSWIRKTQQKIQEELDPFSERARELKSVQELIKAGSNLMIWNTLSTDAKADVFSRLLREVKILDGEVVSILLND